MGEILKKFGAKRKESIESYVTKCVEFLWLMKVQTPPMVLLWQQSGDVVDQKRFTFYTKKGQTVSQAVWPAVLLHDGGPTMLKGIVQGM